MQLLHHLIIHTGQSIAGLMHLMKQSAEGLDEHPGDYLRRLDSQLNALPTQLQLQDDFTLKKENKIRINETSWSRKKSS